MEFDFDPKKSQANKAKHGIDFEEGQAIWEGFTVVLPAKSATEERKLVLGEINGKVFTAIITMRDEVTRIISIRRARDEEEKLYRTSCNH